MNNYKQNFIHKLILTFFIIGALVTAPVQDKPSKANSIENTQSYIIQGIDVDQVINHVQAHHGEVTSRLDLINAVGAILPESEIESLSKAVGITKVHPNSQTYLTSQDFDPTNKHTPSTDYPDNVGADLLWKDGITGEGISVAILDTGISSHPYLLIDTKGGKKDPVVAWKDFINHRPVPNDPNGHGTHIAGIISNASMGQDGEYNGVAPGVNLVVGRVLDKEGTGTYETVIQGIQWVVENKEAYNIKVLNLSLYSLVQSPYWADPLNQAVMRAWAEGITVVVAAGNDGPDPMSIAVPGNNPYVITVGAFSDNYTPFDWSDDYLAEFSSAGPTLDAFVKPDLIAPGAHITSTMMPGSFIARNHEANWVDSFYFSMAGTSQAAAVVSGVCALVLQNNPGITPEQVKYRLMVTSLPWVNAEQTDVLYSVWQQGAGRVNAVDAVLATDINATANNGLDIQADLSGTDHFEGYSYFDEQSHLFRLRGFESLAGGYGSWAGGYGSWAGGYGSWAGGYGSWAGGYGSWAGGYGSWAGGYGSWAGGYGSWAGGYGSWAGIYVDPTFLTNFISGMFPENSAATSTLKWVDGD